MRQAAVAIDAILLSLLHSHSPLQADAGLIFMLQCGLFWLLKLFFILFLVCVSCFCYRSSAVLWSDVFVAHRSFQCNSTVVWHPEVQILSSNL